MLLGRIKLLYNWYRKMGLLSGFLPGRIFAIWIGGALASMGTPWYLWYPWYSKYPALK
jgi:hypothetical protein